VRFLLSLLVGWLIFLFGVGIVYALVWISNTHSLFASILVVVVVLSYPLYMLGELVLE